MTDLYVAVHHVPTPPAGPAIILATELCLKPPWVMGGERVATHAFMVMGCDGCLWRFDGEPPNARWRPFAGFADYPHPVAAWRVVLSEVRLQGVGRRAR